MTGVNPADAATVLKLLLDTWDTASQRMLAAVARRLARGITEPGWAVDKARETLALRDELAAILAGLDHATNAQVVAALGEAYDVGERAAKLTGRPVVSRPRVVQAMATRLAGQLQGVIVTSRGGRPAPALASHLSLYQRTVQEVELTMSTGTITRREAVATSVNRLLTAGADRFPDAAGRSWQLDSYARMAGRTIAGQTAVQGQLDTMVADGRDLVIISDSARECPLCRPWEGRLLSISGRAVGVKVDGRQVSGTVAEARGAGVWHPNCTHRPDPYTPGLTRKPVAKANPEGYKQAQALRALERDVRDLKRRLAAAKQIGDLATIRKLNVSVRAKSQQIKTHAEATGQNRRRDRERPVG